MTDVDAAWPPSRPRPLVAVLGGTGFVGRSLCRRLAARGDWRIRVVTRSLAAARPLEPLANVAIEQADVLDAAALGVAIAGADVVVNLVARLHGDEAAFHRLHVALPQALAQACRDAGGIGLVHVSALGADARASSLYLQSKARGERLVREAWGRAVILRPSVIFGEDDRFTNLFVQLQRYLPVVPLAGSSALFQPVWVEDVAQAITTCLERPGLAGNVVECVGPDVLTLREIVARAGRAAGVARPIVALPDALGQVQAWILEHLPGEPLMSRDNLRSMRTPNIATPGATTLLDVGIVPRSLDDWLAKR